MRHPLHGVMSWFRPRADWSGRHALVPPALGYTILTIYAWTALLAGLAIAASLGWQAPEQARHSRTFWLLCSFGLPVLLATVGRGLPFTLRYALLAAALGGYSAVTLLTAGVSPNWVLLVLMLPSLTCMLYGMGAGLAVFALLLLQAAVIAAGWVRGSLPAAAAPRALDFHVAAVWIRILAATAVGAGGCLALMVYILRTLRATEERFAKAFAASPTPILLSDWETGLLIDANYAYLRVVGASRSQVIGRSSLQLGLWQDPAERERFAALLGAHGSVRDLKVRGRTLAGTDAVLLVNSERIELGGKAAVLTMMQDVTERERIEGALREAVSAREDFARRLIAAEEAERRRIAGELHDSVGQHLLLVRNRAQLLIDTCRGDERRPQFEAIRDLASHAIAEVRQISHDLRPYQLDQLGLTRALEAMCAAAAESAEMDLSYHFDEIGDRFAAESATHIYRIVQESLNNVFKHARARQARVRLERDGVTARLTITDDGIGFEAREGGAPGAGLGLSNIAERARILGARLHLHSEPGRGTRVSLILPVPAWQPSLSDR